MARKKKTETAEVTEVKEVKKPRKVKENEDAPMCALLVKVEVLMKTLNKRIAKLKDLITDEINPLTRVELEAAKYEVKCILNLCEDIFASDSPEDKLFNAIFNK